MRQINSCALAALDASIMASIVAGLSESGHAYAMFSAIDRPYNTGSWPTNAIWTEMWGCGRQFNACLIVEVRMIVLSYINAVK